MKLVKDSFGDLVSSNSFDYLFSIWYGEFRKRDWGFYYIDLDTNNIKLSRVLKPDIYNTSKYYL